MRPAFSTVRPPRALLTTLNPQAGDHPVCGDPRELQAAIRAGERSWRQFPYYERRYAARGQQFTRSDSAWLASLAQHGPTVVDEQTAWLGRVLAARGMPRWLLEQHLVVLHAELARAAPHRARMYAALLGAAERLLAARRRHAPDELLAALAADFAGSVGSGLNAHLPETGALLVAAVADERAGLTRAVPSLVGWMTDTSRFPARWIDAVHRTIEQARERAIDPPSPLSDARST